MHALLYLAVFGFAAVSCALFAVRTLAEVEGGMRRGVAVYLVMALAGCVLLSYLRHVGPAAMALLVAVMALTLLVGTGGHPARIYLAAFGGPDKKLSLRAQLRITVTGLLFIALAMPAMVWLIENHM